MSWCTTVISYEAIGMNICIYGKVEEFKMGKKMGLGLSITLVVIGIAVVCLMIFSSQKTTYYGYMNSNTNAEKVVSEKDGLVKHNIKVKPADSFKPKKETLLNLSLKMKARHFINKKSFNMMMFLTV